MVVPHWLEYIREVDADKVAYIGLNSCMDAVGQNSSLSKAIVTIGRCIELEIFAQGYDKAMLRRLVGLKRK